jgi:hypothetical protein
MELFFKEEGRRGAKIGASKGGKAAAAKMTKQQRIDRAKKAGAASAAKKKAQARERAKERAKEKAKA